VRQIWVLFHFIYCSKKMEQLPRGAKEAWEIKADEEEMADLSAHFKQATSASVTSQQQTKPAAEPQQHLIPTQPSATAGPK
jgi:hypothetical protein